MKTAVFVSEGSKNKDGQQSTYLLPVIITKQKMMNGKQIWSLVTLSQPRAFLIAVAVAL